MNVTKLDRAEVLTRDQELELIEKLKKDGDRAAFNKALVMHNEKLALTFAHKYAHAANYDDLFQEGIVGLAEAARRFDVTRNVKFSCYAYMYVKKYVLQFIYSKIRHDTISEDGKTSVVSMNTHVGDSDTHTELESILKVRADYVGESPSACAQSTEMSETIQNVLASVKLTDDENYVLQHRVLASGSDKTKLDTLSKRLKCSISNIKAIEYRIYAAIREELAKLQIHSFSDLIPENS